jgi:hypothetical protein
VLLRSTSDQTHAFASAAFNNLVINDGLLGYWKFDEASYGNAADSSGFGFHMTSVNTPTSNSTGVSTTFYNGGGGTSLAKASTEYFHLNSYPTPLKPSSAWTISAWVQVTSTDTSGGQIYTADNDYLLTVLPVSGGTSKIRVTERYGASSWTDCDSTATLTVPTGATWHHVVGVYNGSNVFVWVDGTKKDCGAAGGAQTFQGSASDVFIGNRSSGSYKFDGSIDELRVYGRALTDGEILALYAGSQPGSYVSTQKPNGTFSVASDFTIASGNWDDNGQSSTVSGSFYNWGGLMTATGAVTFNTSGTGYIIGNRQAFNTVTMSGTGTLTQRDSVYINGTLNLSAGTYTYEANDSRYKGHFGNINQTGGTLDQNGLGGTNITSSSSNNTFKVTSDHTLISQFRFEAKGETSQVGYWKLDETTGSSAIDTSGTGNTGTLVNGVRWWGSKYDSGSVTTSMGSPIGFFYNGGWVKLDGTDDYITLGTTSIPTAAAAQTVSLWIYVSSIPAATQDFYSLVDATATHNVHVGFKSSVVSVWKSGGTLLAAGSAPSTGAWHLITYTFDGGTSHKIYIDGALSGSGAVSPDSAGSAPYYATIGAYRGNSGTYQEYYSGFIDDVRVYNVELAARQVKSMSQDKYPGTGSNVTWTLGANIDLGSFSMDNGTLDTSTFSVTTTGNCYVPSGVFKISVSGVANCGNDPIIYDTGTLNLAGGTLKVADTKVIQMDGTLQAATTSGTTPTIQVASGGTSYTFRVGAANANDSSTPSPTLNINGLNVKNTDIDGMQINYTVGGTTTVTRFDGVNFSSGNTTAGAALLTVKGNSQYFIGNGCTFNRGSMNSTSYNVKVVGNGTSDGETRAIFGNTTCYNTSGSPNTETCETKDNDDDSGNDGVGDTLASSAGVAQFVKQAYDESQGSIAGFPTPAFNWTTFAYWRTYTAYNNDDGAGNNLIYARDDSGSSAAYTYSIDTATYGTITGVPRWDMESNTHYLYFVTTSGYVFKLSDNGSTLALVSGYPYQNTTGGSAATATSPLVMDATSVYWAGNDGGGSRKVFRVTRSSGALSGTPRAISADITGGLSISPWGGVNYLFGASNLVASNGKIYKLSLDLATEYGSSNGQQSTTNITGRLTVYGGYIYFVESNGKLWVIDTTDNLATLWSYQDTGNGHGACSASSTCTAKQIYLEPASKRVYYGDQDGHVYIVSRSGSTSNGALYTGYPVRPTGGGTSDPFVTAPVYVSGLGGASAGVIAIGSSTGKLFFIDQLNASSAPALIRMYHTGSAVSAISFRRTSSSAGVFNVSTANGKTLYIDSADVADPTPNNN